MADELRYVYLVDEVGAWRFLSVWREVNEVNAYRRLEPRACDVASWPPSDLPMSYEVVPYRDSGFVDSNGVQILTPTDRAPMLDLLKRERRVFRRCEKWVSLPFPKLRAARLDSHALEGAVWLAARDALKASAADEANLRFTGLYRDHHRDTAETIQVVVTAFVDEPV